jgi:hypothetical protein
MDLLKDGRSGNQGSRPQVLSCLLNSGGGQKVEKRESDKRAQGSAFLSERRGREELKKKKEKEAAVGRYRLQCLLYYFSFQQQVLSEATRTSSDSSIHGQREQRQKQKEIATNL